MRERLLKVLGALVMGFVVATAPRVVGWIADSRDVSNVVDRIEPIVVVAGLLLAAYLLGGMSVRWPRREEMSPAQNLQGFS
jgi:hypothetical protein